MIIMEKLNSKLLKNINYSTNLIYENISRIIKSNKSIGVYGNGVYAKYIVNNLKKWSIDVDYYVVDDEYYNESADSNVIKLSSLGKYSDSILIIGFETLIGKEAFLRNKTAKVLFYAPGIEILDFEHCYINYDFISYKYILDNIDAFQQTYNALSDDLSRRVMVEYLNTCISGRSELLGLLNQDCVHDYDYDLLFSNPGNNKLVLECGAFDGKTAIELDDYLSSADLDMTILALEPDSHNFNTMCDKITKKPKIKPLPFGVASKDGVLLFDQQGDSGSTIVQNAVSGKNTIQIPVKSIDSIMEEYGSVNSVLMDIEGSELDVLNGALNTIEKNMPRFAVRVYHKKDDLITIPQYFIDLKSKKYNLYLRNSQNTRGYLDLTLYAI